MSPLSATQLNVLLYIYAGNRIFRVDHPKLGGYYCTGDSPITFEANERTFDRLKNEGYTCELKIQFYQVNWLEVMLTDKGFRHIEELLHETLQ